MAIRVHATCSECFHEQEIALDPRQDEISCPQCGHAVPMLEQDDCLEIDREERRRTMRGYLALAAFAAAFLFFLWLISALEPGAVLPEALDKGEQPGSSVMLAGALMGLSLLASLVFGCMASSRKVVCEF